VKNAWYILLYHNVSWANGSLCRGLNLTCPPDLFADHLETLRNEGRFVSLREGIELAARGPLSAPLFSVWFDDGFRGVREWALPLLKEAGVPAALSICSRITEGREVYWRLKLAWLNSRDCLRMLRSRLRPLGFRTGQSVRSFTLGSFSPDLLKEIDELFDKFAPPSVVDEGRRLFLPPEELQPLWDDGWEPANHTAAHYPVSEPSFYSELENQFAECEEQLVRWTGRPSRYWVLPFDRPSERAPGLIESFRKNHEGTLLGLSENRLNVSASIAARLLYRIPVPAMSGRRLRRFLSSRVSAPRCVP
jgi:peptidoglycan/xylan/chitin deacetylase (PgdA/CDA1 family)